MCTDLKAESQWLELGAEIRKSSMPCFSSQSELSSFLCQVVCRFDATHLHDAKYTWLCVLGLHTHFVSTSVHAYSKPSLTGMYHMTAGRPDILCRVTCCQTYLLQVQPKRMQFCLCRCHCYSRLFVVRASCIAVTLH